MASGSRSHPPFTVSMPARLDVTRTGQHWGAEIGGRSIRLSNLDKVYWPEEGYTKGDLLAYYHAIAPLLLPYLRDRPLTMKRMPDGIHGPFFYEKNAPAHTPDWIPRCDVATEEGAERTSFLMANEVAGVLFVANLGCIEFHPLHSRCGAIEHPDYLFFDLDPFPPATFDDVLAVAHHVRAALVTLGLPSYPKTSGATGMQIYVPLLPGPSYETVRAFVGAVGRAILSVDRQRVTMEWDTSRRTGKVFIDHNMNRRGQNIAAVYSVRPEPGATVSTPVTWEEVEQGVHPSDFTIVTVHERLERVGDLFTPVLAEPVDLRPALESLGLPTDVERVSAQTTADREKLATYVRKRDFTVTPEPAGAGGTEPAGSRFVIQKHDATRLHYDLRLERDGVLVSWAVPKGLPTEPGVKHLAVQTEDHPIEYGEFEGWIPEGNYGAGEVRIFDRGTYEAVEWEEGRKVTFRLHGTRHRGEYHLFRTAQGWLVTLSSRSQPLQPEPAPELRPMLASPWPEPFDDDDWRFEPKLDGIRTLAYVTPEGTRLVSRSGRDQTAIYPELSTLAQHVNALQAVLDGEIVATDESGRPSFEQLQQRMNLSSPADVARARRSVPVHMYAFDILWLDGRRLTDLPLEDRRRTLEEVVTEAGPLKLTLYRDGQGCSVFEAAQRIGFEGMVAKRLGSSYHPGQRSADWRKVKATNRASVVILGWTRGTGSRAATFGSLLVGAYREGTLTWAGQVGTGFTDARLRELLELLEPLRIDAPAIEDPGLRGVKQTRWVRPELVCEVEYLQVTAAGKLRAPSFKGLRPDLEPADCILAPTSG